MTIIIKKDVEILLQSQDKKTNLNVPFDESAFSDLFTKGNTVLYAENIVNDLEVTFLSEKKYKKGRGMKINVVYDVNAKNVTSFSPDTGSRKAIGELSLIRIDYNESFSKNSPAHSDSDGNRSYIGISPNYSQVISGAASPISYIEMIAHELGYHNMQGRHHRKDPEGNIIYPRSNVYTLGSSTSGMILPTDITAMDILRLNISVGRMSYQGHAKVPYIMPRVVKRIEVPIVQPEKLL